MSARKTRMPAGRPPAPPVVSMDALVDAAISLQRSGRTAQAAALYESVLRQHPRASAVRHNLGLLKLDLGALAEATALLDQAWIEDGEAAGWLRSLPRIGLALFGHGCWEDARPWLERAATRLPPDAPEVGAVGAALDRARPRSYLAPEVWDPSQGRSLLRHAPRESASYVYAIDVVGTCNLRCPTCPVGNSVAAERPRGFMAPELFDRILDKIVAEAVSPRPEVWLYNWGEPLLHPQLPALIAAVKRRGLSCHLSTNLNIERGLRDVVHAAPDEIKVSLSGFTPETYARTHAKGQLNLVKGNLHLLRHYLDKFKVPTRVWVGHHLYRDTVSQVDAVAALCRELGFEHRPNAAFYMPLERMHEALDDRRPDDPALALLIEHPSRYIERIRRQRSDQHDCELRFNQTVINHDGTVALCCCVYERHNMLGLSFVDTPHAAIEAARYRHPTCKLCMAKGTSYAVLEAGRVAMLGKAS